MDLGKYASFILSAYGVTAVVVLWLVIGSVAHARKWKKRAEGGK